jgi:membrane protease YdiL (CAAX protease family)
VIYVACAILLAPMLLFGFGPVERLRVAAPVAVLVAYPISGYFRWDMFFGMAAVSLAFLGLLAWAGDREPGWRDWVALAILGISVDLGWFKEAFPVGGLSGLSKLLFVDVGLYGYLVVRPIGGIGYDFRPRRSDLRVGLREFAFYTPIAIALGFALGFLHLHKIVTTPWWFAGGWLFTVLAVAIPEELFFRGLMLNMLERRFGTRAALVVSSLIFGLAHFNKRTAFFNWRYVILAAIAGVFYARAWLVERRVLTSSVTHATVDTVWSIWLR